MLCDPTVHEPASEETGRPVVPAGCSGMCLRGAVLFVSTGFGVEGRLGTVQYSKGHWLPIPFSAPALPVLLILFVVPIFLTFAASVLASPGPFHLLLSLPQSNLFILLWFFPVFSSCCSRAHSSYIQLHTCFFLISYLPHPPHIFILVQITCCVLLSIVHSQYSWERCLWLLYWKVGSSTEHIKDLVLCFSFFLSLP